MAKNLIPTPIVDKNGKATTVHKKTSSVSSSQGKIPAPVINGCDAPITGTPLPVPQHLTPAELTSLLGAIDSVDKFAKVEGELDRDALAVTKRILDEGSLSLEVIDMTMQLAYVGTVQSRRATPEAVPPNHVLHYNRLLIAEHLQLGGEQSGEAEAAIRGLARNLDLGDEYMGKIETEEELAGCSAVVSFMQKCTESCTSGNVHNGSGGSMVGAYIRNKHLDALIRERPDDIDTIVSYVQDRGMNPTNKGPVNALRKHLDENTQSKAVSSGWL